MSTLVDTMRIFNYHTLAELNDLPPGEGGRGELDARLGPAGIDPLATPSSGRPPINWLLITVIVVSVLALATVLVWGVILLRG